MIRMSKEALALQARAYNRLNKYMTNPWLAQKEPFQIVPNVYYIGNNYVGSYLLNTKIGLIVIDVAMQETAYLLLESIRKLGFAPNKVKKIFISHGHIDHCGATRLLKEYCKGEVYFPAGDMFFLTERRDLIVREEAVPEFTVDKNYTYDEYMDCGNMRIKQVHTPGHTPGCTSFIISVDCGIETLTLGMHGGLGLIGLSKQELTENKLPLSLQNDYLVSLEKIIKENVDIVLPSHAHHYHEDYFALAAKNDGSGKVFRVHGDWQRFIHDRIVNIKEVIARDKRETE